MTTAGTTGIMVAGAAGDPTLGRESTSFAVSGVTSVTTALSATRPAPFALVAARE
jgi:hypothetical protein